MDLWSLLPITLTYFVFISFWLQKVPPDNQATITLNKLRFNFPVIGPTPFKSQWPYTGAKSLAYLFGTSSLTFKGSKNLFQNATSVNDSFILRLNGRNDIIKIAPSGSGYLYLVGPSSASVTYTLAFRELAPNESASVGSIIAYQQYKKNLDPVNFTIVPLSSLVSFITFESNGSSEIRLWSDEFSTPTFGKYMMQTFLDSNNAFQMQITELNNTFQITYLSVDYKIEIPFIQNATASAFITNINNAIQASGLTLVTVRIGYLNNGILTLLWQNANNTQIEIGPYLGQDLLHQCAACATLGLYENGEIFPLLITFFSTHLSLMPSVLIWPVTNNYQKYDSPGSADVDGLVNVYFTNDVPSQLINLIPDLVFNASRTVYKQLLTSTKTYVTFEAWAGGGCSILENPKGPFYGGSSSRFQITLNFIEAPIEIFVGFAGSRESDSFANGGSHTSIKYNNEIICVLGGGGGASIGSNGGCGGGPIGHIFETGYSNGSEGLYEGSGINDTNYYYFPGFSGSSKKFSLINNPQILGPSGKPFDTGIEPYDPPGPDTSSSSGPQPGSVYIETWQGSGSTDISGLHGFFVDTSGNEIQTLQSSSGGSGSYQYTGQVTFGGQGASFDNILGAGGGGSTIMMKTSPTFTVSAYYLNGPWVDSLTGTLRPLGGGKGPYTPNPVSGSTYFEYSLYFCNTTNLITELCLTLWNRQKQRQWCEILLKNTASQIFKSSKIVASNYLFGESLPIGDTLSYLAVGPSDLFVPSTGGPNCTNIDAGETILSNNNLTLCIFNDGQITNIDSIPEYLNTSLFGPLNFTTTVLSIRIGPSEPKGTYASCIFLTVEDQITSDGPFTWALKNNEFQDMPPIFSRGTQIQSQGLLPAGSNSTFVGSLWDRQINLPGTYPGSIIITSEFHDLIASLYLLIPNIYIGNDPRISTNFLNPMLPYKYLGSEILISDYISKVWPAKPRILLEPGTANLVTNSLLGLRVFVRPISIPNIKRPLKNISILNFGQDSEIGIPEGATTTIYCFGAGGSSVGTKIGADGSFAKITLKIRGTLVCRVGQAGGSGKPVGICGGLDENGDVLGGGCSFVETSDGHPVCYAGGGGSAGQFNAANRIPEQVFVPGLPDINFLKSSSSKGLFYSNGAGGSGYNWGQSGNSYGSAGSSGTSFAPSGLVGAPQNQKYYSSDISFGSTGLAGNGRIVIEFTY